MMLVGFIWAALAPLSLVLLIALITWQLRRAWPRAAIPLATVLVLAPVATIWLADRAEFTSVCEGAGQPVIYRQAKADGIYLNSGTSNSFGMRYLYDEGFAWVEAPSIYKREAFVRYARDSASKDPNAITTTDIPAITARYEVREEFSQPFGHTGLSVTKVVDRTTGDVLAKAGSATFGGGRMTWVLGAWGQRSCPSAMSDSKGFTEYYHLAKRTLR
jgi:hypothetical protein